MCEHHRELLDLYRQAVSRFSATLEALRASQGTVSKQEYDRLYGYVEQARMASEQARLALERHVAEHGCDYVNAAVTAK
jgi:hypothetical protein